jgi:hypothetical protein
MNENKPNREIPEDAETIDLNEEDGPTDTEQLLLALGMNPKATPRPDAVAKPVTSDEDMARFASERGRARDRAHVDGRKVVAKSIKRGIRKVAGFGSVAGTESTEREVVHQEGDAASEATKKRLDDQLEDPNFLVEATGGDAKLIKAVEENKDKLKDLRDQLSGLFTVGAAPTVYSKDDAYIEGVPGDANSVIVNPDSGTSGVRMKFTGKNASTDEQNEVVKTAQNDTEIGGQAVTDAKSPLQTQLESMSEDELKNFSAVLAAALKSKTE